MSKFKLRDSSEFKKTRPLGTSMMLCHPKYKGCGWVFGQKEFDMIFERVEEEPVEERTCATCGQPHDDYDCPQDCTNRSRWQPREPEPTPDPVAEPLRVAVDALRQAMLLMRDEVAELRRRIIQLERMNDIADTIRMEANERNEE